MKNLLNFFTICAFLLSGTTGCASRLPLLDAQGDKIDKEEVEAVRGNTNLLVFTVGGTALSFGLSFFTGSLVDRKSKAESNSALWAVTGVGTVLGAFVFARKGQALDHNQAVASIQDDRSIMLYKKLEASKEQRNKIELESEKLKKDRHLQEEQRKKMLDQLKAKNKNKKKNEGKKQEAN